MDKEAQRKYNREYYHKVRKKKKTDEDRKKLAEYHKEWRKKNRQKWKKYQTCNRYNINEDQLDEMMSETHCPICGIEFDKKRGERHSRNIDHCHDTNLVRGVLCHHCNVALGWFDHDIDRLGKAIDWLRRLD